MKFERLVEQYLTEEVSGKEEVLIKLKSQWNAVESAIKKAIPQISVFEGEKDGSGRPYSVVGLVRGEHGDVGIDVRVSSYATKQSILSSIKREDLIRAKKALIDLGFEAISWADQETDWGKTIEFSIGWPIKSRKDLLFGEIDWQDQTGDYPYTFKYNGKRYSINLRTHVLKDEDKNVVLFKSTKRDTRKAYDEMLDFLFK